MMEAAEEDPEFDFMIGLNILSCSEEKANRFIIQEDKQLPMTKWKIAAKSAAWQGKLFLTHFSDRETDALYGKIRLYSPQYDSNIIARTADLVLSGKTQRREVILTARRAGDLVNRYADTVHMPSLQEVCALIIASSGEECDLDRIKKAARQIPVVSEKEEVINEPLDVNGKIYYITAVSMGNPHAIVYMDDIDHLDIEKIGPAFENHVAFPDRVNTEFVEVIDEHTVKMRVWERGSGETLACGTGACAVAVASI